MTDCAQPENAAQAPIEQRCVQQPDDLTYFAFARPHGLEPPPGPPSLGSMPEVLAGRYRIERLLGAGGMGTVYRARDLLAEQYGDPDPYVALKLLNEALAESPDASALLYSEFRLTRHLRHDNVLRLHAFQVDIDCQRAFIVMELMRGMTLDKLLCERPLGLPWKELRDIAVPLLDALAHAHGRGVLHGDMKPSNVMLSEEGVRVFDFGLGQAEEDVLPGLPHLRRQRFNAWTPAYAAPELLENHPITASADVYAVACLIFELAGGKHPYRRLRDSPVGDKPLHCELQSPGHLPKRCWPALRTALAPDAGARNITARQLREAFAANPPWWRRKGWANRVSLTIDNTQR
jgi:serine/threonine-protein kinase Stk1